MSGRRRTRRRAPTDAVLELLLDEIVARFEQEWAGSAVVEVLEWHERELARLRDGRGEPASRDRAPGPNPFGPDLASLHEPESLAQAKERARLRMVSGMPHALSDYLDAHPYGPHLQRIAQARHWAWRLAQDGNDVDWHRTETVLRRSGIDEDALQAMREHRGARSTEAAEWLSRLVPPRPAAASTARRDKGARRRAWVQARHAEGWGVPRMRAGWPADLGPVVTERTMRRYFAGATVTRHVASG